MNNVSESKENLNGGGENRRILRGNLHLSHLIIAHGGLSSLTHSLPDMMGIKFVRGGTFT